MQGIDQTAGTFTRLAWRDRSTKTRSLAPPVDEPLAGVAKPWAAGSCMALRAPGLSPFCISDSIAAVVVVVVVVVSRCRLPLLVVVVVVFVEVMSFIVVVVGFVGVVGVVDDVVADVICALLPPTPSMPTPLTPTSCSNLTHAISLALYALCAVDLSLQFQQCLHLRLRQCPDSSQI